MPLANSQTSAGARLAPGLYVVATPIGNLGDMTFRGVEILKSADLIACEDTRTTKKLLHRFGISTRMRSYHEHNEKEQAEALLKELRAGKAVALVSDAGTPLIADPGYRLVKAVQDEGISVYAVPGANAAIAAMSIAGLPTHQFFFAGFPPPKEAARQRFLELLQIIPATLVFYEAPHRLAASLKAMADCFGAREAAVARELTKLHEEVRRGTLAGLALAYEQQEAPKGECVILVGPPPEKIAVTEKELGTLLRDALATQSVRDASSSVAEQTGVPRHTVYQLALSLRAEK